MHSNLNSSSTYKRRQPLAEINVVPYVDVMLVLLVIFMITTPLLTQGVAVDLPKTQGQAIPAASKEPLIVSIDAKGAYYLNVSEQPGEPLASSALMLRMTAELKRDPSRKVLVKGDRTVDYGRVVQLMALLQESGAQGIGLITEPSSPGGPPAHLRRF